MLQCATILAVGIYFWKDLLGIFKNREVLYAIILGTIPAVIAGLFLEDTMATVFRNVHLIAYALTAGSVLLWVAERYLEKKPSQQAGISNEGPITKKNGLLVGLFQVLSLIPGISRSGATISGGLFLGFTREQATRFSFLLSFPILLGSGLKKLYDLNAEGALSTIGPELLVGSLVAFIVGMASIHFLIRFVRTHTFTPFILYRILLSAAIFLFF